MKFCLIFWLTALISCIAIGVSGSNETRYVVLLFYYFVFLIVIGRFAEPQSHGIRGFRKESDLDSQRVLRFGVRVGIFYLTLTLYVQFYYILVMSIIQLTSNRDDWKITVNIVIYLEI